MSNMFYGASSLNQLDLSNWDFGSVTNMSFIFFNAVVTTESYSDMLMQIVDTSSERSVPLGAHFIKHNNCVAKAKAELESRGWIVIDAGPEAGANAANCTEWDP